MCRTIWSLLSVFYYVKLQFNFLSRKQKIIIIKEKKHITDRTDSRAFFKGKWFPKTIFERRTCTFHSVLRYFTARTVFHGTGEYIHIIRLLIFCSFFLWKMLLTGAQYLLSGAESDDGSLTEINFESTEKRVLYHIQPQIFWLYNVIGLNVTYK
jgi:hypothetical protein